MDHEALSLMQVRVGEYWPCLGNGMFLFWICLCHILEDKICPRGNTFFLWSEKSTCYYVAWGRVFDLWKVLFRVLLSFCICWVQCIFWKAPWEYKMKMNNVPLFQAHMEGKGDMDPSGLCQRVEDVKRGKYGGHWECAVCGGLEGSFQVVQISTRTG